MRALYAISGAALALGCGSTPEINGETREATPVMTDLRIGGCAPVRYRELDPERKPKEPPKPRVGVRFRVPGYLGTSFQKSITAELEAVKPRLTACFKPSDIGENAQQRVTLTFYLARGGRVMRVRARGSARSSCIQGAIQSRIRQLQAPRNRTSVYVSLHFFSTKNAPEKPDRIVLVEGRDRVASSLALAAAVAGRKAGLERCVRAAALAEPGQLAPTLSIKKGAVTSVETGGGEALEACATEALSSLALDDPKLAGVFQCAASYGLDGAAAPAFATTVTARAIAVGGGEPIDEALIREQRPPAGPLYRQLSERRFAPDGGATTALRIAADAPGALIVRATEAAAAADVDIGAIEVPRGEGWASILTLSRMEPPRLSSTTGQAAGPVVVVDRASVWAGAATGELELELETSALDRLDKHLAALRARAGLAHRTDAIVGVAEDVDGALIGQVLERVGRAGIDQLELVPAETARARLAR